MSRDPPAHKIMQPLENRQIIIVDPSKDKLIEELKSEIKVNNDTIDKLRKVIADLDNDRQFYLAELRNRNDLIEKYIHDQTIRVHPIEEEEVKKTKVSRSKTLPRQKSQEQEKPRWR